MGKLTIMDHTGDTLMTWDENNAADAERVYNELVEQGHIPVKTGDNQAVKLHTFDPTAEEIVMIPKIVGG